MVDQVVERLDQPWLGWRLVGFEVDGVKSDLASWLTELGLDSKTEVFHEKAKTPHNQAELDHLRIDVCLVQGQHRQSREFFEVMLLAAVTELWKCVGP
jgi:predicted O-methyltransferase YrrM